MPHTSPLARFIADTLSEAPTPLDALTALDELGTVVEDLTTAYGIRARNFGHTWVQIGEALGVTAQAAQQRFGAAAAAGDRRQAVRGPEKPRQPRR